MIMSIRETIKPLVIPTMLTLYTIMMLSLTPILAKILITIMGPSIIAWVLTSVFVGGWLYSLYRLTLRLRNTYIS